MAVKLIYISRGFFFLFVAAQAGLLSQFVVEHYEHYEGKDEYGFYALAGMFLIPLIYLVGTLCRDRLKDRLSIVWLLYSCVLVIMIGVIFGRIVIEDNKLREQEIAACLYKPNTTVNDTPHSDSLFDSKSLKVTLCFTPGLMLLLLTSVADEDGLLKQLYLTTVLDLFDGVEMVEVLHEDVCNKIPKGWEYAVLVAAILFFLLSFLEIHQVKFDEENKNEPKERKKTAKANIFFQIILNVAFLVIRLVLWFKYDFDSAVFLAKNVISLVITLVDILERCDVIEV